MSIKETSRVWEHSKQDGTALLLLLAIADSANDQGHAWPGREHLAQYARCDIATVSRLIAKMEAEHELYVARKAGSGNHYMVLTGLPDADKASRCKRLDSLLSPAKGSDQKSLPRRRGSDHQITGGSDTQITTTRTKAGTNSTQDPLVDPSVDPLKESPAVQSRKQRPRDPLFDAIVDVCVLDPQIAGSYVGKTKQALIKMGKTAEDVRAFGDRWYREDWRGQKGQPPTLHQLVTEIRKVLEGTGRNGGGSSPDKGQEEDADLAARQRDFFARKAQEKAARDAH